MSGITPEQGIIQLLVSNGRGKKVGSQGHIDLFQLVNIEYSNNSDQSLIRPTLFENIQQFSSIAQRYTCFMTAGEIANFLLHNLEKNLPQPLLYQAILIAFNRLANLNLPEKIAVLSALSGVYLTLLQEEGLLAHYPDSQAEQRLQTLINLATTPISPLILSEKQWQEVKTWLQTFLTQFQFKW